MALVVRQQQLNVHVTYHQFCFQESDESCVPVEYPDGFEWGKFVNVFPGRIDVFSAGHTHTASVGVEVWDSQPPEPKRELWDEVEEVTVESATGQLAVWDMGRSDDLVWLGSSGGTWRARMHCKGREETKRITEQDGSVEGVEKYVVQFWPQ
ncbi:hypothetical protein AB0I10_12015 [Streptomyces sp. NPDC050636]|uniref:hypothetical protein n=1 Tax=Streptomyces sp. NPDC050636 TaxID=3154510 RepID=UPI00344AE6E3